REYGVNQVGSISSKTSRRISLRQICYRDRESLKRLSCRELSEHWSQQASQDACKQPAGRPKLRTLTEHGAR
ncbi:hypothetical protein CH063_09884, partial [Colletotrichum higginsianum]